MARYSANYYFIYGEYSPGIWTLNGHSSPGEYSGEISNGEDLDPTFNAGDEIEVYNGRYFVGTIQDSGNLYVIVSNPDVWGAGTYLAYTHVPRGEATAPSSFLTGDISTAPLTECFLEGTLVSTPAGSVAVEDLEIGQLVLTVDGEPRPVRWVGRQTVVRAFSDPLRNWPVRIAAGALAAGMPTRDLFLSPDHALLIGGLLVQAAALVNDTTICRVTAIPDTFVYYHVETEGHALILAEGTPAETFVDNVTRRRFDNYAAFAALYGESSDGIAEIGHPRVKSARQLPRAIRDALADRARVLHVGDAAAA